MTNETKPKTLDDFFPNHKPIETGVTTLDGKEFKYRVYDKNLNSKLSNFVGFVAGELFISEEVPEKYRNYFFLHEINCVPNIGKKNHHCVSALQYELSHVPKPDQVDYINFRKSFFEGLIHYHENESKATWRDKLIVEMKESLKFLNEFWDFKSIKN